MNRETTLAFFIGACFVLVGLRITDALEADAAQAITSAPPPRSEFGAYAPACGHLYNVNKHRQWAECMGVGHVTKDTLKTMKREDI